MCQVLLCFNILVTTGSEAEMLPLAKKDHCIKYPTKQPTLLSKHTQLVGHQRTEQKELEYDGITLQVQICIWLSQALKNTDDILHYINSCLLHNNALKEVKFQVLFKSGILLHACFIDGIQALMRFVPSIGGHIGYHSCIPQAKQHCLHSGILEIMHIKNFIFKNLFQRHL